MALIAREEGGAGPSGPDRLLAEAAQVARHADARLSAALHDLFLPDFIRPTDLQRAAMANMLHNLVAEIEVDLREAIIDRMGDDAPPVLSVFRIPIIRPIFDRAGVLRDRELVALLLSRAEDHRISNGVRRIAQIDPEPVRPLDLGVSADLEATLRLAESRRTDSHGEPFLTARDLPADLLHRMLWWGAAALRDYMERMSSIDPVMRDEVLTAAVLGRLAAHDEGQALDAAAMRVAMAGPGTDALLFDLFRGGRFALFVAVLAVRARIDYASAFMLASDPGVGALAVLLRSVDVSIQTAAPILLQIASINGLSEAKLEERVNDFLDLDLAAAQNAIRPYRLNPAFRHAVADIGRERRAR
jgi:hypothetical protein